VKSPAELFNAGAEGDGSAFEPQRTREPETQRRTKPFTADPKATAQAGAAIAQT
jgi:hypothetical protein